MNTLKLILLKILGPFLLSKSKISSIQKLSDKLLLVTIKGKSIKKASWTAGQKVSLKLNDEVMRSYTPMSWDQEKGEFTTLAYLHKKGPFSNWFSETKINSSLIVMGPRASVTLKEEDQNIIFFGDETTFGLVYALENFYAEKTIYPFFESTDFNDSNIALDKLNLKNTKHFPLDSTDIISHEILTLFKSLEINNTLIILSGKQQSIVKIRDYLKNNDIPSSKISIKVYWGWKDDPNGKLSKQNQ